MKLSSLMGMSGDVFTPYLNTGTSFDLATGMFEPGMDSTILNGGLSRITGIVGRPQKYKSAEAISLAVRALVRYKDSELFVHDSEFSIPNKQRIINLSDMPVDEDRIELWDNSLHDTSTLLQLIRNTAKTKVENKKDFTVESPFLQRKTGKPIPMFIPTIFIIDSISKLGLNKEDDLYDKHLLGDSKLNMVYMQDGNAKTQFMRQLPMLAAKAGIYIIITAHLGNKFELDPFSKSPKDLQYMKGADSVKNAGSQFLFLCSTLLEARNASNLVDSNKKCMYPESFSNDAELNVVDTITCRCKNNASGSVVSPIVSQYQGILSGVSDFHYLKKNNMYGLSGNVRTQTCDLYPNESLTRQNVRKKIRENYELSRAIEILGQLCYIQNNWSAFGLEESGLFVKPKEFVDKILANKDVTSEILNSRGYWTYDKDDPRKYMSLMDITNLINKDKKKK